MTPNRTITANNEEYRFFFQENAANIFKHHDLEVIESLQRRKISISNIIPLEQVYKISVKIGKNIPFKSGKKLALQQMEAVGEFLQYFQISILGQPTSIFQLHEIEIKIDKIFTPGLTYEAGKLLISIPDSSLPFQSRYLSDQELKNQWNKGNHLSKKSLSRKAWWLLNPIGEFRTNLRTVLWQAAQKQILGIDKLLLKFGLIDRYDRSEQSSAQPSLLFNQNTQPQDQGFREGAIALIKNSVNEEKLGIDLEVVLKDQDEATLGKLLGLFRQNLADAGQIEELIEAGALTLQQAVFHEQSEIDIKMFGFVNVGNYHRIDVSLNLSAGYLKKYVELIPRKAVIKAIQFGFVNVYTIDDITVNPNFHGAIKLYWETAALEKSLQELSLVNLSEQSSQ
ncbi:MAG: hypothetical protein F6J94_19825 [Moorea sp. SIO1F2]|uniref:hypothetical protein n=1 Tax=Moorena sp. SIO1F2 TaxID=2607819 RepID=UPI0013BBE948|nr:hypothetical protein [Moorena sp. SIO1F2]NET84081.1 hypothetical protein [Moorena sp. SIO1F2]